MALFWIVLQRELRIAYRKREEIFNPWLFFLISVALFSFILNIDDHTFTMMAPSIIWVNILYMTLLSIDRSFRQEVDHGVVEQWLLMRERFIWIIASKMFVHWFLVYLPLWFLLPVLAVWMHLNWHTVWILLLTLLLGTPILSFVGNIFSALFMQLRQGGLLLALISLPFYVPVLIFAISAVMNASLGLPVEGQLAFLGALLAITLPLAPLATAAALKIGIS